MEWVGLYFGGFFVIGVAAGISNEMGNISITEAVCVTLLWPLAVLFVLAGLCLDLGRTLSRQFD